MYKHKIGQYIISLEEYNTLSRWNQNMYDLIK